LPLVPEARKLFEAPGGGIIEGNVWGRPRGLTAWSKTKRRLDQDLNFNDRWTLHDIRRSAATLLAGEGFLPHHIEAFLGHAIAGGGLIAVYQRHDYAEERVAMAEKLWEMIPAA
jgi:integrase